jgi:AcrR family transcriptional regulator
MAGTRRYTQVKRADGRERTRAAILDAAEAAFFASRWERVTLEDIAEAAGVTKQTLLRHFGSKAGLLAEGSRRGLARVASQRLSAPANDIDGAVDNLLDHYEARGEEGLKIGAMEGGEDIADVVRRARQLHYDWVDHAFGAWLERTGAGQRVRLRAALIALCDVHAWQILSRDLGLSRAEVRDTLILAIRRLLEEGT